MKGTVDMGIYEDGYTPEALFLTLLNSLRNTNLHKSLVPASILTLDSYIIRNEGLPSSSPNPTFSLEFQQKPRPRREARSIVAAGH